VKSARNTLPEEPVNAVTCGIDWARDDHAVSVVDARGREISRRTIAHDAAGLTELVSVPARAGVSEAAIERPDGPVVDALLDAGITVVVISPNQVKNLCIVLGLSRVPGVAAALVKGLDHLRSKQ
jgi:Transposase